MGDVTKREIERGGRGGGGIERPISLHNCFMADATSAQDVEILSNHEQGY